MATTNETPGDEVDALRTLFDCLASEPRRRLLGLAYERAPDSLTRRDLAVCLTPSQDEKPLDKAATDEFQQALVNVHHTHLPKLDAAGLLDHETDRGKVALTDHPAFQDAGIVDAIHTQENADATSLDALFGALADPRRRTILASLNHSFQEVHTETLARDVGAREQDMAASAVPADEVEQILVSLRHNHLPHLSEAGLIECDTDEQMVVYDGDPNLSVTWLHSVLGPDFRAYLTGNAEAEEVGTIEGREEVVAYSQSLLERADDELFSMFTATDLLECGCFARVMDASRRGVDVYLGTRDPVVRDLVRENAPEVILWEPESDWLNLPVEEDRVGRLLMADREAVMLGTLGEQTDDGLHEEQAIIGEGTDNVLVAMIRQMLGSRLEQIDNQTEDIDAHLPF